MVACRPCRFAEGRGGARSSSPWATEPGTIPTLVAAKEGWANVPPGTRSSLYANAAIPEAAPFAQMTLDLDQRGRPYQADREPVPYTGVQFVAIPEFQGLGDTVGQMFSAALAGSVERR